MTTENVFIKTTTTWTLSDGTLTVTPIVTLKPTSTLALLRQRATIPYVRGTYEIIARTQQPYNIGVARKLITTLRQRERKKTMGLMSKTTTLHVHHAFLYIPLPSLHNYVVK